MYLPQPNDYSHLKTENLFWDHTIKLFGPRLLNQPDWPKVLAHAERVIMPGQKFKMIYDPDFVDDGFSAMGIVAENLYGLVINSGDPEVYYCPDGGLLKIMCDPKAGWLAFNLTDKNGAGDYCLLQATSNPDPYGVF